MNRRLKKWAMLATACVGFAAVALGVHLRMPTVDSDWALASDVVELSAVEPARQADRLSLVMRGVLASPSERDQLASGSITLSGLADSYRTDERFAQRLAQYWIKVLKADSPFDFAMVENAQEVTLLSRLQPVVRGNPTALIYRRPAGCAQPRFELFMAGQATQADVDAQRQRCNALPAGSEKDQCENRLNNLIADLERTNTFRAVQDCNCSNQENERVATVSPWWNPSGSVRVCQTVMANDVCGANLGGCIPLDSRVVNRRVDAFLEPLAHDANSFFDDVFEGLTLEPAMLIAKSVQEDRDYRSVLTTTETVVLGAVETFLLSAKGSSLRTQAAGNFANGANLRSNDSTRKSWRWVERAGNNAGVLTTPQFQQATNGYRAKANRAYEAFLCRQFVIPPGVSDTDPDELDLTKRQPCASCHIDLEPMGNMFKRWPEMGTNFLYNASLNSAGSFRLHPSGEVEQGVDVPGLARILVKDDRFAECAVQRAYEFLVGRAPEEYDFEQTIPKWKSMFVQNGYKLWPVMQEIIRSVHFQGGWK